MLKLSDNIRNLTSVTYYIAFSLLLVYIFLGIAGIDLLGIIRSWLNAAIITIQQLSDDFLSLA